MLTESASLFELKFSHVTIYELKFELEMEVLKKFKVDLYCFNFHRTMRETPRLF